MPCDCRATEFNFCVLLAPAGSSRPGCRLEGGTKGPGLLPQRRGPGPMPRLQARQVRRPGSGCSLPPRGKRLLQRSRPPRSGCCPQLREQRQRRMPMAKLRRSARGHQGRPPAPPRLRHHPKPRGDSAASRTLPGGSRLGFTSSNPQTRSIYQECASYWRFKQRFPRTQSCSGGRNSCLSRISRLPHPQALRPPSVVHSLLMHRSSDSAVQGDGRGECGGS